jgi:segregation and condensation protein B
LGHRLRSAALRYRWPQSGIEWPPRGAGRRRRPARSAGRTVEQGFGPKSPLARVEAALFLAREPVPSRKLAQLANVADGTQARSLVRQLRKHYDARGRAFQVEEVAGGFQLLTRRKFAPWLRRLERAPSETRLSQPAMETLAVVAYRQPVPRAEIEAIRGVQCGEILRQLMQRDLVRIVGRAEELGRPFLYGTTKRFLQWFGLKHLDDIPRADQLRPGPPERGCNADAAG